MKNIMSFLGDANTPIAVSNIHNGKPQVRFLSFKMIEGGKLYFLTSKKKKFLNQLVENNNIQICSMPNENNEWLRITAKVDFIEDLDLNKKAFEILPLLQKVYETPANKDIILLAISCQNIIKYSLSGEKEVLLKD